MRTLLAIVLISLTAACTSANSAAPPEGTATGSPVRASSPPPQHGAAGHVTARWVPNMNWHHAHPVTTRGSEALARKLHHDIAVAKLFPRGAFACPMDAGVRSRLVLAFGTTVEHALVTLTGCPTVTVPGHRARVLSAAVRHDLLALAPHRYQQYLRH